MASQYDTLLAELRAAETAERRAGEMTKAVPAGELFGVVDGAMRRSTALLNMMTKSFPMPTRKSRPPAPTAGEKREAFAKSLEALNLRIGEAAASGALSALEICRLQSRLHALAERAAPHLRAVGL